jgi:hypothetical protein
MQIRLWSGVIPFGAAQTLSTRPASICRSACDGAANVNRPLILIGPKIGLYMRTWAGSSRWSAATAPSEARSLTRRALMSGRRSAGATRKHTLMSGRRSAGATRKHTLEVRVTAFDRSGPGARPCAPSKATRLRQPGCAATARRRNSPCCQCPARHREAFPLADSRRPIGNGGRRRALSLSEMKPFRETSHGRR